MASGNTDDVPVEEPVGDDIDDDGEEEPVDETKKNDNEDGVHGSNVDDNGGDDIGQKDETVTPESVWKAFLDLPFEKRENVMVGIMKSKTEEELTRYVVSATKKQTQWKGKLNKTLKADADQMLVDLLKPHIGKHALNEHVEGVKEADYIKLIEYRLFGAVDPNPVSDQILPTANNETPMTTHLQAQTADPEAHDEEIANSLIVETPIKKKRKQGDVTESVKKKKNKTQDENATYHTPMSQQGSPFDADMNPGKFFAILIRGY